MKTTETHGPPTSKHHFNQKSFIQEIQKAKFLWDTNNVKYNKDQTQTELVWERIANQFKIPKLDAMRRWTVMRAKYRQEKQNPTKSLWPLYNSMTFLDILTIEKQPTDKSYSRKDKDKDQKRSSGDTTSSSLSSTAQHKSGGGGSSSSSSANNVHHRRSSGSSKDKPYSRPNKYSGNNKDNKPSSQNGSRSSSVTGSGGGGSSGDLSKSNKAIINDVNIKIEPDDEYENNNKNDESNNGSNNNENNDLLIENFPGDDDNEFIEVQIIDGDDEISISDNCGLLMGLSDNIVQHIKNNSNNHKQNDETDMVVQHGYESKCRAFGKYIGEELCSMKDEGGNAIIIQIMHLILQAKNK